MSIKETVSSSISGEHDAIGSTNLPQDSIKKIYSPPLLHRLDGQSTEGKIPVIPPNETPWVGPGS